MSKYPHHDNRNPRPRQKKAAYVKNADLPIQIAISKERGRVSEELGRMMQLMAARYFLRANYRNYSYRDEMRDEAVLSMLKAADHTGRTLRRPPPGHTQDSVAFSVGIK